MTSHQQGVLRVRLSLVRATHVAGFLSILAWAAPLVAQGPTVPRPPAAAASPPITAGAPAPGGTSVVVIDVAAIFKNNFLFNAKMNEIKKDIEAFEGQIRAEQEALAKRGEGLKSFSPTSPDYKNLEEQLARAGSEMQVKVGLKKKEFLEKEARVYFDVYQQIYSAVA